MRERIQRLAITRWTVPAPQLVAVARQILGNVVTEESRCACYRDLHLSSSGDAGCASQPTGQNLSADRDFCARPPGLWTQLHAPSVLGCAAMPAARIGTPRDQIAMGNCGMWFLVSHTNADRYRVARAHLECAPLVHTLRLQWLQSVAVAVIFRRCIVRTVSLVIR